MSCSRRNLLAAGAALLVGLGAGGALAQTATVGAIRVDAGPAAAKGAGEQARVVAAILDAELRREFAGRMAKGGPTLVVSVHSIWLNNDSVGRGDDEYGTGGASDYLETTGVLVGPRGQELARHTILSPVPSSSTMLWSPEQDRLRFQALATHNAGWMRRYMLSN